MLDRSETPSEAAKRVTSRALQCNNTLDELKTCIDLVRTKPCLTTSDQVGLSGELFYFFKYEEEHELYWAGDVGERLDFHGVINEKRGGIDVTTCLNSKIWGVESGELPPLRSDRPGGIQQRMFAELIIDEDYAIGETRASILLNHDVEDILRVADFRILTAEDLGKESVFNRLLFRTSHDNAQSIIVDNMVRWATNRFAHDIANGSITVSGIERFFSGCGLLMFSYLQSHKDRKSVMNRDLAGYLEEVFEEVHELDFDSNGFSRFD